MTMIARTIYKAAARLPISRNLMRLYTAKEGARMSRVLNRVLGTEDALARIALFRGEDEAYQVARAYLNSRYTSYVQEGSPIDRLFRIASNRTDDYGSASLLANLATARLKEAGHEIPVISSNPQPRWNASLSLFDRSGS